MKLYYAPGACSLAPHIVAREAGIELTLERVELKSHKTEHEADYYGINPKGSVPLLELDNGERLSEGQVISQYLGDHAGKTSLVPPAGSMARYRVMEWLAFVTMELQKSYYAVMGFLPVGEDGKAKFAKILTGRYAWIDKQLEGRSFLTGEDFTAADAHLFVVTSWAPHTSLDLSPFANVGRFAANVRARPAVVAAMRAEGLIKN